MSWRCQSRTVGAYASGSVSATEKRSERRRSERRNSECGSALLIVFVFAAVLAIMLYRELPVTLFEAQRQKEELLVDRGHEYVRAVQLFYRRNHGQYPASIEQLEDTNRVRYLRRKYKDPFTGKDDWRLLHAGPGGMLMDSKVNPLKTGNPSDPANAKAPASETSTSEADSQTPAVAPLPQRPPAIKATAGPAAGATPTQTDQDPGTPLLTPTDGQQAMTNPDPTAVAAGQNAAKTQNETAAGTPQNVGQANSGINPINASQQGIGFGSSGRMMGGAIAGVASTAHGHGIKRINEQSDYALWEFYYDPTKDKTAGMPGQVTNNPGLGNAAPGATAGQTQGTVPSAAQPNTPPPATPGPGNLANPIDPNAGAPEPVQPPQ